MALRIKNSIPNTITCLNLLSGCLACILAFRYAEPMGPLFGFQWAFICIGAATVFDFADGASARILHAYSAMGKELDSLADLISFGLAPALLMFNAISLAFPSASGLNPWAFGALLIAVLGALRLAKFNIDTRQTTSFIGLPIPSNAIFWIGFLAWAHTHGMPPLWLTLIIVAAVSLLMVSELPMFSLKFKNFAIKENLRRYIIMATAAVLVAIFGVSGLAWTILVYILISALWPQKA